MPATCSGHAAARVFPHNKNKMKSSQVLSSTCWSGDGTSDGAGRSVSSEKWHGDEDSSDSNTSVGLSGLECGSLAGVGASVSAVLSTASVGSGSFGDCGGGGSVLHKAASCIKQNFDFNYSLCTMTLTNSQLSVTHDTRTHFFQWI